MSGVMLAAMRRWTIRFRAMIPARLEPLARGADQADAAMKKLGTALEAEPGVEQG